MNLDEKIKEILEKNYMEPDEADEATQELKQLFLQELKACLPERKEIPSIKTTTVMHIAHNQGFNTATSEVEQNINKLSEEGVEK